MPELCSLTGSQASRTGSAVLAIHLLGDEILPATSRRCPSHDFEKESEEEKVDPDVAILLFLGPTPARSTLRDECSSAGPSVVTNGEAVSREPGAERTRRASLDRNRALASALSRAQPAVTAERMPCAPSRVEVQG